MKQYALHIPEGVKDYIGEEAALKEVLQNQVKKVFYTNSYHLVETPSLEYLDVFTLGQPSFQAPSLYHLVSREGELMALRSDMTRAIARVVCTQNGNEQVPQRYSYLANNFRYPQRYQGKLHEFTQAGIELIGNNSLAADAEVIRVAVECLKEVGMKDFNVHIGSSQFFDYALSDLGMSETVKTMVYEAIEKKDAVTVKKLLKTAQMDPQMVELLLEWMQCAGKITLLRSVKAKMPSSKARAVLEELETLYRYLEADGISEYVIFDLSLMNFGQYYTGMMFQIFTMGIGSAIVEGGRYDQLLCQFGKDLPAVGFGMHINLVLQSLMMQQGEISQAAKRTLVVWTPQTRQVAQRVSNRLREQGEIVESSLTEDLEEAMAYAKQIGISRLLYFKEAEEVSYYDLEEETMSVVSVNIL